MFGKDVEGQGGLWLQNAIAFVASETQLDVAAYKLMYSVICRFDYFHRADAAISQHETYEAKNGDEQ